MLHKYLCPFMIWKMQSDIKIKSIVGKEQIGQITIILAYYVHSARCNLRCKLCLFCRGKPLTKMN